jgi:hypothetical protein
MSQNFVVVLAVIAVVLLSVDMYRAFRVKTGDNHLPGEWSVWELGIACHSRYNS